MIVEILKCKDCGAVLVIDVKKLFYTRHCSTCDSMNIEKYDFDDIDEGDNA